jgi:hypothetical protein
MLTRREQLLLRRCSLFFKRCDAMDDPTTRRWTIISLEIEMISAALVTLEEMVHRRAHDRR